MSEKRHVNIFDGLWPVEIRKIIQTKIVSKEKTVTCTQIYNNLYKTIYLREEKKWKIPK